MPLNEIAGAVRTLRETPDRLRVRLDALAPGELDWKPDESWWSPREVLAHLADVETAFAFRLRLILAENEPAYPAFDEEAWAVRGQYARQEVATVHAAWAALRAWNLDLFDRLTPDDLERAGTHAVMGRQTLRQVIEYLAAHDRYHHRRLDELAARWKEAHP